MVKISELICRNRRERNQKKRRAAKSLAGLVQIVAVDAAGNQRFLEGDEAVEAVLRQWEVDEAE